MGMPQRRHVFASLNPRKKKCMVAPVSALVIAARRVKTGSTLAKPPTALEYLQFCARAHCEKVMQELSVTN